MAGIGTSPVSRVPRRHQDMVTDVIDVKVRKVYTSYVPGIYQHALNSEVRYVDFSGPRFPLFSENPFHVICQVLHCLT